MPTIVVQGKPVRVSDSFFGLSPEEQSATVRKIAEQLTRDVINSAPRNTSGQPPVSGSAKTSRPVGMTSVLPDGFVQDAPTTKNPDREPSQPEHSWSELPGNVVPSAVGVAAGLWDMVTHPQRTAETIVDAAQGGVDRIMPEAVTNFMDTYASPRSPETKERQRQISGAVGQALKDRYWGLEKLKNTMITDPVGIALDVGGIAAGGLGLARGPLAIGSRSRLAESPAAALNVGRPPIKKLGQTIAEDDIGTPAITKGGGTPGVGDVKEYPLFDPPDKPQRPFEADYTKGVKDNEVDEAGNLLVDMDGDPFIAKYKVGRLTKGGDDVGLTPDQYKALAEDIIGQKIEIVPRTDIGGSSGRFEYERISRKPSRLLLADDIKKRKKRERVLGHETGHALHVASGLRPAEPEMLDELRRNYGTLATGDEYRSALVLPSSRRYSGVSIEHELIAEAFRAALTNPNYMKGVAPKTYAILRKWIKSNPELAKLIQLNSFGAAAVATALGATGKTTKPTRLKRPRNETRKRTP